MNRFFLLGIFCLAAASTFAQDSAYIRINFLYGSKPARAYRNEETKWFGGIWGGHVGIGMDTQVLSFNPQGEFHWFARTDDRHSHFTLENEACFWQTFGGCSDSMKKTVIIIPVALWQKQKLDSIATVYYGEVPYDYAFLGMRCAAAAYEILGQLDIVKPFSCAKTCRKIFYPRKLRRRLLKMAEENSWQVTRCEGTARRKWERD